MKRWIDHNFFSSWKMLSTFMIFEGSEKYKSWIHFSTRKKTMANSRFHLFWSSLLYWNLFILAPLFYAQKSLMSHRNSWYWKALIHLSVKGMIHLHFFYCLFATQMFFYISWNAPRKFMSLFQLKFYVFWGVDASRKFEDKNDHQSVETFCVEEIL